MSTASPLESALAVLGRELRDAARAALLKGGQSRPAAEGDSDVQYGVDVAVEEGLAARIERLFADWLPIRVISEGLPGAGIVIGKGSPARRLVIDPVDGTRGLMHDKRSAFVLAGVAPEADARLGTLEAAAIVEIPVRAPANGDVTANGKRRAGSRPACRSSATSSSPSSNPCTRPSPTATFLPPEPAARMASLARAAPAAEAHESPDPAVRPRARGAQEQRGPGARDDRGWE